MKNKLTDLNNYLFEQLERINDDDLSEEELDLQITKSKAIVDIADKLIRNGELALQTTKFAIEYGFVESKDVPQMLLGVKDNG